MRWQSAEDMELSEALGIVIEVAISCTVLFFTFLKIVFIE